MRTFLIWQKREELIKLRQELEQEARLNEATAALNAQMLPRET